MSETTAARTAEIEERLTLCTELVTERPYSHPVACGWYADDVPFLLALLRSRTGENEKFRDALTQIEEMTEGHPGIARLHHIAKAALAAAGQEAL